MEDHLPLPSDPNNCTTQSIALEQTTSQKLFENKVKIRTKLTFIGEQLASQGCWGLLSENLDIGFCSEEKLSDKRTAEKWLG